MRDPIELNGVEGAVPIKLFLTHDMMPDAATIRQLEALARAKGLRHHVAVLPDIHRKGRNVSPTGTVVAAENVLLPRAVDTGICCGIRMLRTNIEARAFTGDRLDAFFGSLMRRIPVLNHENEVLTEEEMLELVLNGGRWSQRRFGLSDEEMACMEDRATAATSATRPEDILEALPKKALKKGRFCFGTMGDGNHFIELQEVAEVLHAPSAKLLGLEKGSAFVMIHTGSRSVGSKAMKGYLKEWEGRESVARENGAPIWAVSAESPEGVRYARAIAAASNFGFANRMAITEQIRAALQEVFHDAGVRAPLLYDCAHVSIKQEDWDGKNMWIHRHGASRALPASRMADHPVFSKTGQPVPIPGSMGHDSYVGVAAERSIDSFFSINHGAGRRMDKPEASTHFSESQVVQEMAAKNIRLYRYGSDNIAEQAPNSFKSITDVIRAMSELALATPVARVRPLAVLKG